MGWKNFRARVDKRVLCDAANDIIFHENKFCGGAKRPKRQATDIRCNSGADISPT